MDNLPFEHLNLRRNPFGAITQDEQAELALVDIERMIVALDNPRYVVQFLGEKGYGKTTHLLAIAKRFEQAAYLHIPEGERREIPSGSPLLIDEAQRLTLWQRHRLFRAEVPLVLGTHRDFRGALRRAGRRVDSIDVDLQMSSDRLHQLLNARIERVRRSPGPVPRITTATANELWNMRGPNVRGILHELYGVFQELPGVQNV